jgi:hypothetical protein
MRDWWWTRPVFHDRMTCIFKLGIPYGELSHVYLVYFTLVVIVKSADKPQV